MYSLDILLSLFGTSPLFHVRFCCFLTCIQVSQEAGQVDIQLFIAALFIIAKLSSNRDDL